MSSDGARTVDSRAVRVSVVTADDAVIPPMVVEPSAIPVGPAPRRPDLAHGDAPAAGVLLDEVRTGTDVIVLVDGEPTRARIERVGEGHATVVESDADERRTDVVILGRGGAAGPPGTIRREVLVDGWAIVVDIESERRASLRERASRGVGQEGVGGPFEIRAVIPGRVVSVAVAEGDTVSAGQQLLIIEAMKMQNESRAARDGVVSRVAVGPGQTIELGDLLVVLG